MSLTLLRPVNTIKKQSSSTPLRSTNTVKKHSPNLKGNTTQCIQKIYSYFKKLDEQGPNENDQLCFLSTGKRNIPLLVGQILGIEQRTIRNRLKIVSNQPQSQPARRAQRKRGLDSFEKEAIRNLIYRLHEKGTFITIKNLLKDVNENIIPDNTIGHSTLITVLHDIGFKFKRFDDCRLRLMERKDVFRQRVSYLKAKKRHEAKGAIFVYLDETWVNKNHHAPRVWTDGTLTSTPKVKIGKGHRLIITHAGNKNGFINGALDAFWSNTGKADYHQDMNAEYFEKWYEEQFLPSLEEPSVIIMDNARYHSRRVDNIPTFGTRKPEMLEWLEKNNIQLPDLPTTKITKKILYPIIKAHKPSKIEYAIDQMTQLNGHEILRLPPYHCIFNPIEMIWANTKTNVGKQNMNQCPGPDVKQLFVDACAKITSEDWKNAIIHAKEDEDKYWEMDGLSITKPIQPIVIDVNYEDSSDESDNDDELMDID